MCPYQIFMQRMHKQWKLDVRKFNRLLTCRIMVFQMLPLWIPMVTIGCFTKFMKRLATKNGYVYGKKVKTKEIENTVISNTVLTTVARRSLFLITVRGASFTYQ